MKRLQAILAVVFCLFILADIFWWLDNPDPWDYPAPHEPSGGGSAGGW